MLADALFRDQPAPLPERVQPLPAFPRVLHQVERVENSLQGRTPL
jgi:hypothetical protein